MKTGLLIVATLIGVLSVGAVLLHSFPMHSNFLQASSDLIHSGRGASDHAGPGLTEAAARAREGVVKLGRRWDAAAKAETVSYYAAVHRELEWPGVLAPATVNYGTDAQQSFRLFRPEQAFSEPGPVFVFLYGDGLEDAGGFDPQSEEFIYGNLGKLAATFGGIGIVMADRRGQDASIVSRAEHLRAVIEWIVEHISPYGGDPGTIVLLGNSAGATTAAAYLFNEDLQLPTGTNLAAAFLSSGLFGEHAPEISGWVDAYDGEPVPLALWAGEFETRSVADGIQALHEQLCAKYQACPWFEELAGHNHVSHIMSLGTSDTAVQNSLIRFYHTVR